jgi:hypothetical protein
VTRPAETAEPQGYPALLEALVALGIVRAVAAFEGIVGDSLVSDLPEYALDLLADVLGVVVWATNSAARSLAVLHVDAVVAEAREAPVRPSAVRQPTGEPDRLRGATRTLLDRVAEREREQTERSDRARRLDAEQAEADVVREAEDRALDAEIAAARAREQAEDRALDAEIAAARAREQAEDAAADAEIAADRAALDREQAAEAAAEDAADAETEARARRADRERRRQLADARRTADREQARQSARQRIERLARAEAYKAAADAVQDAAQAAPEVLGWVRALGPTACPTCVAWLGTGYAVVRPTNVPMKRHPGCDCTRRLIIYPEELNARGYTDRPEAVSERWKRARDRERAAAARAADAAG